jgi:hypothetical protein
MPTGAVEEGQRIEEEGGCKGGGRKKNPATVVKKLPIPAFIGKNVTFLPFG